MSGLGGGFQEGWIEGGPERLYVVTAGQGDSEEQAPIDLVTLIVSRTEPRPGMHPEHVAILRMCSNPLSVAEISAHLNLPTSTVTVLVANLIENGHVEARTPAATSAALPGTALLEAVMDGLRKI